MFPALVRIMFLRGSPERILYQRRDFIVSLFVAIAASAVVQFVYFIDTPLLAGLRVFAELTMFMLWMTLLTAKVGRLRLAQAMLILIYISIFMDSVLITCGVWQRFLPFPDVNVVAVLLGLVMCYGGANVVAWALRKPLSAGALQMAGYALAVVALDGTFRYLFGIMAA